MRRTRTTRGLFVFNLNDYSARPRSCGLLLNCIKFLNCIKNPRVLDVVCVSAQLLSAHAVGTPVATRASVKRHTGVECEALNALAAIAQCVARKQGVTKHVTLRLVLRRSPRRNYPHPPRYRGAACGFTAAFATGAGFAALALHPPLLPPSDAAPPVLPKQFPIVRYETDTGSGKNIWTGNIYFLMACPL
jgi:hypothetical protein